MSHTLIPRVLWSPPGERLDDDCACPDSGLAAGSGRPVFDSDLPWQTTPALHRAPLPDDHSLAFNPPGPAGVVVLNEAARRVLDAYARPRLPAEVAPALPALRPPDVLDASRQLAALGLLQPSGLLQPAGRPEPQTLTAWLHVTNACNLRCTYCYLNKTNAAMDEATGRAAVEAVFRSARHHGFRAVKLKYAGGEATLNFPLVRALHAYARALAAAQGLALREVVLSNGVGLTPAMLEFLRAEGVRLMISLDGVGAAHDAQRIFANGRGSFMSVAHSLDRALAHGVRPHLSITVTARNAGALAEAVAFALDRELLFNLNFFRENDCAAADLRADEAALLAGMRQALAVIEARLPRASLLASLVDRASFAAPHDRACGAGHSYLVIDERGGVARCQMEIEKTVADVFAEDPLGLVRAVDAGFQNIAVNEKEGCRDCEWRYWCAGGCPLLTFKATGRNDVKSPNCHIYKALYPEVLRLEGLRLLRWHAAPIH